MDNYATIFHEGKSYTTNFKDKIPPNVMKLTFVDAEVKLNHVCIGFVNGVKVRSYFYINTPEQEG